MGVGAEGVGELRGGRPDFGRAGAAVAEFRRGLDVLVEYEDRAISATTPIQRAGLFDLSIGEYSRFWRDSRALFDRACACAAPLMRQHPEFFTPYAFGLLHHLVERPGTESPLQRAAQDVAAGRIASLPTRRDEVLVPLPAVSTGALTTTHTLRTFMDNFREGPPRPGRRPASPDETITLYLLFEHARRTGPLRPVRSASGRSASTGAAPRRRRRVGQPRLVLRAAGCWGWVSSLAEAADLPDEERIARPLRAALARIKTLERSEPHRRALTDLEARYRAGWDNGFGPGLAVVQERLAAAPQGAESQAWVRFEN